MQKISLAILLAIFATTTNVAAEGAAFKKHTFEISFTQGFADYFFINPNNVPGFKSSVSNLDRPFAAFNMGIAYMYRPIRFFGVSAGIDQELQGIKMGYAGNLVFGSQYNPATGTYTGGTPYTINFKGYQYNGYLQIPVLLHGFLPFKKIGLELATGPVFSFPVFNISNFKTSSVIALYNGSTDKTIYYPSSEISRDSWLAWTVQCTVNIPVGKVFALSVGPEARFLNVSPLHPSLDFNSLARISNYYIGCKIGFRFGGNFNAGAKTPVVKGDI